MSTGVPDRLPIRPYARLLTMLGEQLIKNDRIALIELIKNSYDADATEVIVRLDAFGPNLETLPQSRIVITDNGDGMSNDVIRNHWLNPATSIKVQKKRLGRPRTVGGRAIQGEKGIGRFAMFKLGSQVQMTTRAKNENVEFVVDLDISFLDTEQGLGTSQDARPTGAHAADTAYLDELSATVTTRQPVVFSQPSCEPDTAHGTRLEITKLRSQWSPDVLKSLHKDVLRLRPLSGLLTGRAGSDPLEFKVRVLVDGASPGYLQDPEILLNDVVDRAVLRVVGDFDCGLGRFALTVNDVDQILFLNSHEIRGLRLFRETFGSSDADVHLQCGDFTFEFLFFDLRSSAPTAFKLDKDEKSLIRDHRIYLYRDDVRVLPYGDPEDDWLQLDVIRGTQAASRIFSNDQTLGFVYITQEHNRGLRDKTNREGLIDSGSAFTHFVLALQLLITHLRRSEFARYLAIWDQRSDAERRRHSTGIESKFASLDAEARGHPRLAAMVKDLSRVYQIERDFLTQRVERTEDLAGIGLSVETASHDVVSAATRALRELRLLHEQIGYELGSASNLYVRGTAIVESLSFIVSRLQDVQGLFVSSRQKPRDLDVVQFVRKVESIYRRVLAEYGIIVHYVGDEKFEVKTVDAVLLQVFLNLMDNSVYWLGAARVSNPSICVVVNGSKKTVTFADNGPGVDPDDVPYIFDAFFSAKGDQGRGLGLYIAREVARRNGFELSLLPEGDGPLPGACFLLDLEGK